MSKLFRPQCLRRMVLFLVLVFPLVYFVLGLSTFLLGAHGVVALNDEFSAGVTWWDKIFSSPFGTDNFISNLGYSVLVDTNAGFNPFAELIRYLDVNFFHYGSDDGLALFVYGYCYYVINTLVIYMVVSIVVKLILLPLRVMDRFDGKETDL